MLEVRSPPAHQRRVNRKSGLKLEVQSANGKTPYLHGGRQASYFFCLTWAGFAK